MHYCKIEIIKGKKKPDFGKKWGAMPKKKANASFIQTGNGLYVIDIDTKIIPKKYKKWVKFLGSPTVETANGYHYYIKSSVPMNSHGNIFKDKEFNVDIRGKGGLIFTDYWGNSKKVWYKKVGKKIKDKDFSIFKSLPKHIREPNTKKERKEKHSDVSKETIKRKLKTLDPDMDYESWLRVGMALYDWSPKKGLKLFDKWSKKSDKYDGSTHKKWSNFDKTFKGQVTIGTLLTMGKDGQHVERVEDEFKHIKKKKKPKKEVLLLVEGRLTDERLKQLGDQKVLFKDTLVHGMHTFLYGAAGSNKTTVAAWIGCDVIKHNPDMIVHFWSFDAAVNHEKAIFNYCKEQNITDEKFQLITGKTSSDFKVWYDGYIEAEIDLSSLIIVIDTFKFITSNVNDKNANKKALHYIKELQALGATCISLGHTNKDGIKQSGTAEIEQDSDAILRIDREIDQFSKAVTLSISSAGRTRFSCEGVTLVSNPSGEGYEYLKTAMDTMKISDEFKDIATEVEKKKELEDEKKKEEIKLAEQEYKDYENIRTVIMVIKDLKDVKATLPVIASDLNRVHGWARSRVDRVLELYTNKYWQWDVFKEKGRKATKLFKLKKGYKKQLALIKQ